MRRLGMAAGIVFLALGCAGAGEWAASQAVGGDMEIVEGGVVIRRPDGRVMRAMEGGSVPEGFEPPLPWEGADPQAVIEIEHPEHGLSHLLTFDLERPPAEVIAVYRGWLEAQGVTPKGEVKAVFGTRTEVLQGTLPDEREVVVTVSQIFGHDQVTVGFGRDLEAAGR